MEFTKKIAAVGCALAVSVTAAACTDSSGGKDKAQSGDFEAVTVKHAFGETVIDTKPERVATVDFANQEVPLALGIVPVGMSRMTWGDDDGDGIQPWTEEKIEELGGETPVLFDETDGYDFDAVEKTKPDVILAGYSGMTKDDYQTLSEIAPVVPYPDAPWATPWRDSILQNAKGLGLEAEGEELIGELEKTIEKSAAKYPDLKGATAMFMTHIDPSDLSTINFYSAVDTRSQFFEDLGMKIAPSVVKETGDSLEYNGSISGEKADEFDDADVIVTYGGDDLIKALDSDPLLSKLKAVENDAVVHLDGSKPIGTAANPTALSIPALIDDYTKLLADAVAYTAK